MRAESFDFIFDHGHNCLSMKRNNVVGKIVLRGQYEQKADKLSICANFKLNS